MTTEKQVQANHRNATKSTGPKSVEGKNLSSQNATTHGLLAKAVVVHGETANALIMNTIRDEVIVGVREDSATQTATLVETSMRMGFLDVFPTAGPYLESLVDVKIVKNWGEAK